MNWNMIEGNWRLYRNELLDNWSRLSGDGLANITGQRSNLSRLLQDRYGISSEDAEQQISQFLSRVTAMPRYHADRNHCTHGHPRQT